MATVAQARHGMGFRRRLGLWAAALTAVGVVPLALAAPAGNDQVVGSAQFSLAFFATILTGEAVIFALAFASSSSWPSLREIDAHIAFRMWVVVGWIGSMVLGIGMLTDNREASTYGAVIFLLTDVLGIFSFVRLFGLVSAGGRRRLLSRTLQRRLSATAVSVAELADRIPKDELLSAYVRELDSALIAGDGNAVRDRVEELTEAPAAGEGAEARAGLHLEILHHIAKAGLTGRLDSTVAATTTKQLIASLVKQIDSARPDPGPGEMAPERAAALAGHLSRYLAWLAGAAWTMSVRQVAPAAAARELIAVTVTARDSLIYVLDPDPPHATSDADLHSVIEDPVSLLAWIRGFVEFHGSAQAAAFYPVYELLTGTKFQGNYFDGASILTELREALFGDTGRVDTEEADRARAAFGTVEEFDRIWALVSVTALATLRDAHTAHPPELIRPEFTPDHQLLAAYLRTWASHQYPANGTDAYRILLRLLAHVERPDGLWARSTALLQTCSYPIPTPHTEPHHRLAATTLAVACRLAPLIEADTDEELRRFLHLLPADILTATHQLTARILPTPDAEDTQLTPVEDVVRRLDILRLPALQATA